MCERRFYFTKNAHDNAFIIIPKKLFTAPEYKSLSAESKLMYGLLLDRESLSEKNGWLDEDGRVFVYFTLDEMADILNCGRGKTVNLFRQLAEKELIERDSSVNGKPSVIYINRVQKSDCFEFEKKTRPSPKNRRGRVRNPNGNNTEMNNTELSNTDTYTKVTEADIREQIEYDCLCPIYGRESVDSIVCLIADTLSVTSAEMCIGGNQYPTSIVKQRLRSLNSEHIGYALEVMAQTEKSVTSIDKYLLTILFRAPSCMDSYFENKVRCDQNLTVTQ